MIWAFLAVNVILAVAVLGIWKKLTADEDKIRADARWEGQKAGKARGFDEAINAVSRDLLYHDDNAIVSGWAGTAARKLWNLHREAVEHVARDLERAKKRAKHTKKENG